jgi:tripeptidyl-peptidase-1
MVWPTQILLTAVLAAIVISGSPIASRQTYAVKDSHPVPARWSRGERAPADHVIQLHIGLKQNNFNELERHLYEGPRNGTSKRGLEF